jgi:hypothetical protein
MKVLGECQPKFRAFETVSRAVDLGGGSEEVFWRSDILNNWGNDTI